MALHHERFWCHLPSSIQTCTLSFNPIHKIPKIISYETVYIAPSCFALYLMWRLCATSSVYYVCVTSHTSPNREENPHLISCFKVTCQQYLFPHTVFKVDFKLLGLLGMIKYAAAAQRNAIAKPQERTSLCVPRSVHAVPSEPDWQLCLHFLCDFNLRIRP